MEVLKTGPGVDGDTLYSIVLVILEDGLVSDSVNYFSDTGGVVVLVILIAYIPAATLIQSVSILSPGYTERNNFKKQHNKNRDCHYCFQGLINSEKINYY